MFLNVSHHPLLSWTIAIAVLTDFLFPVDEWNPLSWHVKPLPSDRISAPLCHVGLLAVLQTVCDFSRAEPLLSRSPLPVPTSPPSLPGEPPFRLQGTAQASAPVGSLVLPAHFPSLLSVSPMCPCPPVLP